MIRRGGRRTNRRRRSPSRRCLWGCCCFLGVVICGGGAAGHVRYVRGGTVVVLVLLLSQEHVSLFDFLDLEIGPKVTKAPKGPQIPGAAQRHASAPRGRNADVPRGRGGAPTPAKGRGSARGSRAGHGDESKIIGLGVTQQRGKEREAPRKTRCVPPTYLLNLITVLDY